MPKKKKKRTRRGPSPLSPKQYVVSKARKLPIYESLISEDWQEAGIARILIARKHKNGHITCGLYLVDLLCSGVKDTFFEFNIPPSEYEDLKEQSNPVDDLVGCEYTLAHKIIYGAVEFAEGYGIRPHKDFVTTQYLLDENDPDMTSREIEFGEDGKPCLVTTFDGEKHLANQLEKAAGKGNYKVVYVDADGLSIEEDADLPVELNEDGPEDEEDEETIIELTDEAAEKFFEDSLETESVLIPKQIYEFRDKDDKLRTYNISFGPTTPSYFLETDNLDEVEELHHMCLKKPRKAIPWLQEKIKRYPKSPIYYNYLANAYTLTSDYKAAEQVVEYSYQRFPDYLFAKCNYALNLLQKNKVEKIPAVFENKFELELLYPDRTEFHISEFLCFYGLICRYFIAIDEIKTANIYGDVLKDFDYVDNPIKDAAISELELRKSGWKFPRKLAKLFK